MRGWQLLAGSCLGPQEQELGPDTQQVGLASPKHTPVWDTDLCFCFQGHVGFSKNQSVVPRCWYVANDSLKVERARAWGEDPLGPRALRAPSVSPHATWNYRCPHRHLQRYIHGMIYCRSPVLASELQRAGAISGSVPICNPGIQHGALTHSGYLINTCQTSQLTNGVPWLSGAIEEYFA